MDEGDVEGAAAFIGGVLLPVEIGFHGLRIERRAVVEFDAGPELEGPGLVVVGMGPGLRQLRLRLAFVIEIDQGVENRRGRGQGGGVIDPDLERIETRNIELQSDRDAAALLLRQRRAGQ